MSYSARARHLRGLRVSATALALGLLASAPAFAQTPPAAPADSQANPTAGPSRPIASAEISAPDIVVTASRITTGGFTAPTPTTVISAATFEARAAVNIATVLYELPSVRPSPAPQVVSQTGGNFVNLRGLGTARSLVLVDGRRFVGSNNLGQVDTNLIPSALIERLDAVTGGASAAWGSDAVSGVLNLVLKKKLDGFQGNLQYGISQRGDNNTAQGSLAWGHGFGGGRGQFMIAGEYSKQYNVPTQGDRSWSNKHSAFDTSRTRTYNGTVYDRIPTDGLTLTGYTNGGVIVQASGAPLAATSPLYGKQFLSSASSSPFNYGQVLGSTVAIGGDGGWFADAFHPTPPLERGAAYARASYELTDTITATADVSYGRTQTKVDLFTNSIPASSDQTITIQRANPFIPADIRAILNANPNIASFNLGRIAPELGAARTESTNQTVRGVVGLDGKLGSKFTWNAYYTHGETHFDTDYKNNIIEANLRAALDVVTSPTTGQPVCRITLTAPVPGDAAYGAAAGCTPANPFGPGSLANVKNYVTGTLGNIADYHQDAGGVTLNGEPFSTWAGPVSIALGGEAREEYLKQVVSPISNFVNPPLYGSGGFQQANPKDFRGGIKVQEGFGEVAVPLLREMSFAKALDFNGAVRLTHYSTSGTVATWKLGGTYSPVAGLLFRATRSHDIRAPNTSELYVVNTTYGAVQDWGVAGAPRVNFVARGVGNTALKPEIANTITAGVSLSGRLIHGLSLSVDYYKIKLRGSIGQLGTQGILDTCYGQGTAAGLAPNPASCGLIDRGANLITNQFLNLGTLETDGIDFEGGLRLPYRGMIGDRASLSFRVLASCVHKLVFNTNGLLSIDRTGDISGAPRWRVNGSITLQDGPLTLFAQGRYIGPEDIDKTFPSPTAFINRTIPAYFYLNASIGYAIVNKGTQRVELYVAADNLLDRDPPFIPSTNGLIGTGAGSAQVTNQAIYDVIGRAFRGGVRFHF